MATVSEIRTETPSTRTLVLDVPEWPGHLAGQHVDIRLTAPDGYRAQRSYSIASAWTETSKIELTVQRLDDGEVSPYLTDVVQPGDQIELRGPVGGWFVWRPTQSAPVLLVGGGSGVVPLMAMIRQRTALAETKQPFRLVYSVRSPEDICYADELQRRVRDDVGLDVRYVYTRKAPDGWPDPPKRIDVTTLTTYGWPPDSGADVFVCGPTSFVEAAADILVAAGHEPSRIRTERFGGK